MSLRLRLKGLLGLTVAATILLSVISSFAGTETINYTYDNMGRLIKAEYENGTVIQYVYDKLGNRLEQTITQGTPNTFILAASKTGTGTGNVTGTGISCSGNTCTGTYAPNTQVTLTATADASSTFYGWSGCDNSVGNQCTVTMSANRSVSASFTSTTNQRTLTVNEVGTGSGTVSGQGLDCVGHTCTGTYAPNTGVTLTAVADTGSTFSGWSGCDSVNGTQCTLTMSTDRTVSATFTSTPSQCTLTVNTPGTGSGAVSSTGLSCRGDICTGTYARGAEVRLTATPSTGSTFSGWVGDVSVDGNQCTVIMDVNKTVQATFTLTSIQYTLTVTKAGSGTGNVTPSVGSLSWSGNVGTATYDNNTSVTLTATANSGSLFAGWSGEGYGGTGPCTIIMNAAKAVTATFVHFLIDPNEGTVGMTITITGSGFGSRQGKVLVGGLAAKVTGWAPTRITCTLSKVPSVGATETAFDVGVQPKGASSMTELKAFTVKPPTITANPGHGKVGSEVTLTGEFLGPKKGKINIGGKSCQMRSWPTSGQGDVRFVIPRGLTGGGTSYQLTISNAVGTWTGTFIVD
jgi:YD repeat-containing protein